MSALQSSIAFSNCVGFQSRPVDKKPCRLYRVQSRSKLLTKNSEISKNTKISRFFREIFVKKTRNFRKKNAKFREKTQNFIILRFIAKFCVFFWNFVCFWRKYTTKHTKRKKKPKIFELVGPPHIWIQSKRDEKRSKSWWRKIELVSTC